MHAARQNSIQRLKNFVENKLNRFSNWIWSESEEIHPALFVLRRVMQWTIFMAHGFTESRLLVHASALTYTTLLTILPLVAVAMAIVQVTGIWTVQDMRTLAEVHLAEFSGVVTPVLDYVSSTDFSKIGVAGLFVLVFTVISMMDKVERAFNEIWDIKRKRTIFRKVLDYALILVATSVAVLGAWGIKILSSDLLLAYLPSLQPLLDSRVVSQLTTITLFGVGFTFLMRYMPNTKVPWPAATLAGFCGGALYSIVSIFFFDLQLGVVRLNIIYGSLAAIPITIIWIDVSWIICLLSAELSFTLTHFTTFRRQALDAVMAPHFIEESALKMVIAIARLHRANPQSPVPANQLAKQLHLPLRIVFDILDILKKKGLVELDRLKGSTIPDHLTEKFRMHDVRKAVRETQINHVRGSIGSLDEFVNDYMTNSENILLSAPENVTIAEAVTLLDSRESEQKQPEQSES